jgi:predicted metal-dependent HD superfamily phosphohydrolase
VVFNLEFRKQLASITNDEELISKTWDEINVQYGKPGRYYHNLSHLDKLTELLFQVFENILDWQTLVFSIAFHDIIYDPLKKDNEEKSASFANQKLIELGTPDSQRNKCVLQILATKGHEISKDNDTNYFTDADLAILGSSSEEYKQYTKLIRKEYKFYPDLFYRPGRKKVLQHFLQMPYIYKTNHFRKVFEEQARINMETELEEIN